MWTFGVILIAIDVAICLLFIGILIHSSKNKSMPKLTDEEYREFIEWYNKKKKR